MMCNWRAYFADGSVYDGREQAWERLPKEGIIASIAFFPPTDRISRITSRYADGYDWQGMWKETIITNNDTLQENRSRYPECTHWIRGVWVPDKVYHDIADRALHDRDRIVQEIQQPKDDCGCGS